MKTSNKFLSKQIRNVFMILGVASLSVSCNKDNEILDEVTDGLMTITAATEQGATTRTSLGAGTDTKDVLWTTGDKIKVFSSSSMSGVEFTLKENGGNSTGTFTSTSTVNDEKYAIYPSGIGTGIDGATLKFVLPATQIYNQDGFANGAFPMVAVLANNSLAFKNLCGIIKLSLKGTHTVTKIVITSSAVLSGKGSVDMNYTSNVPVISMDSDGNKFVTLDCGDGVVLDATAKDFYIVVPPIAADVKFTVEIESAAGFMSNTSKSAVERSKEVRMLALDYLPAAPHYDNTTEMTGTLIGGRWWAPVNVGYDESTAKAGLFYIWNSTDAIDKVGILPGKSGATSPLPTLGSNHACPAGWERPTKAEYEALVEAGSKWRKVDEDTPDNLSGRWFGSGASTATVSNPKNSIFFPNSGYLHSNGTLFYIGSYGTYWSSTADGDDKAHYLNFSSSLLGMRSRDKLFGRSVRCVKNK